MAEKNRYFDFERAISHGSVFIDFEHQTCQTPDGRIVHLGPIELRVLTLLQPDRYRTLREIIRDMVLLECPENELDGEVEFYSRAAIPVYVNQLRRKLGEEVIKSSRSFGYRLR